MQLISSAFEHNHSIPSKFTCDAENISPPLTFTDVPDGTQSLVLIVEDPDAVSKAPFTHWVLYNITSQTKEIAENSVPKGTQEGLTDFGRPGWGGPCPPSGSHRYVFKLYALDKMLDLEGHPDIEKIKMEMRDHLIEETSLIGLYQRRN